MTTSVSIQAGFMETTVLLQGGLHRTSPGFFDRLHQRIINVKVI
jgi:hypothetical protein